MTTTLVIRLSSLGDVVIALPVVYSVAKKHPEDAFLLLTQSQWQALFVNKPANLTIFPVDTRGRHQGIWGIFRLLRELSQHLHTQGAPKLKVADLHGVIRSFCVRSWFRLQGIPVEVIDKGRKEKRALVRKNRKILKPLKTSLARYQEVFEKLGYDASLCFEGLFPPKAMLSENATLPEKPPKECIRIGIAPFAKHKGKTYPLELMEAVVSQLNAWAQTKDTHRTEGMPDTRGGRSIEMVLLGSEEDRKQLAHWEKKYATLKGATRKASLEEELFLINQMDLVLSMDSANMHLASLVNTPVVSIWGATHPFAGFYGWNQDTSNALQAELPCRPCSVFGNKPCHRGDYVCLKQITPERVVDKIKTALEAMS